VLATAGNVACAKIEKESSKFTENQITMDWGHGIGSTIMENLIISDLLTNKGAAPPLDPRLFGLCPNGKITPYVF
jgi:hypothetical protein